MAFSKKLAELFVSLTMDSTKFKAGLTSSEQQAKRFHREVKSVGKGIAGAMKLAAGGVAGLAAALGAREFQQALTTQVQIKAAMADTARILGLGTVEYSKFAFAAESFGVAQSSVNMVIQRMIRNVAEAAQGTGEAQKAFRALQLDTKELAGLKADEQFERIASALGRVATEGDRIAIARKIFDSEGAAAALKMADGFEAAGTQLERLGNTLSEENAQKALEARDAMVQFGSIVDQTTENIVLATVPALNRMAEALFGIKVNATLLTDTDLARKMADATREQIRLQDRLSNMKGDGGRNKTRRRLNRELEEITAEIERLDKELRRRIERDNPTGGGLNAGALGEETDEQRRKREEREAEARRREKEKADQEARATAEREREAARRRREQGEKEREAARATIEKFRLDVASETEQIRSQLMEDLAELQRAAMQLGLTPDAAKAMIGPIEERMREEARLAMEAAQEQLDESIDQSGSKLEDFARRARENLQDSLSEGILRMFDDFDEGLKGMLRGWIQTLKRMAAEAIALQIAKTLFGGVGGGFLSKVFGMAQGGKARAGEAYYIEPGRPNGEVFVPDQDGRFIPGDKLGGDPVNVNVAGSTMVLQVAGDVSRDTVEMLRAEMRASEARLARGIETSTDRAVMRIKDLRNRRRL